MKNPTFKLLLSLLMLMMVSSCKQAEEPAVSSASVVNSTTKPVTAQDWDKFVTRQLEDYLSAHPQFAVMQGRHEYDGQLPDWSREGINAEIARLHAVRENALSFPDEQMNDQQQYQREYIVSRVDQDLFWMEKAQWPFRNPQFYFGWLGDSLDPGIYITLDYASKEERLRAFTRYLKSVPIAVAQIRENLAMPMPRPWLQLGIDSFGGYAAYFRDDVPAIWADVENPELQIEFAEANREAINAMQGITDWLVTNMPTATSDYALGPELYQQMLWDTERVDIPLDRLEAIGRADMARNIKNLKLACEEFAPGASLQQCMAKMSDNKPEDSSVEAARRQIIETRQFVIDREIVSIPSDEAALVAESPPYARSNSAYINTAGPWEQNQPSVYYISPPNPEWSEQVQRDYIAGESDLLFTSIHEVWPGHFLNFLHAKKASFFYGRVFVGYAFAEGWAHYTEEMMLEAGLRNGDPEARIGQISNALLRDARFLSSIGLHTKGWSLDDSRRFFMEEGFQGEGTAIQQSARGTYDPAYLNYTMGKLLIKRLRDDWTATRGGREAWKEFHDQFLSYGGPPIPLVRKQMMAEAEPVALFPAQK